MRWSALVPLLALALLSVPGCGDSDGPSTSAPAACHAADVAADMDEVAAEDVGVYLDAPASAGVDVLRSDLEKYLPALWGLDSITVSSGAPDGSKAVSIWITTSDSARDSLGVTLTDGYVLRRSDQSVTVYAADETNLAYATYGFLERLGARFFHPKAELIPSLGGVRLPKTLDVTEKPAWPTRGIQEHTLHPIEMMSVLNEPSAEHLADAKQYIDWLVKTGQNLIQWPLMDTVPWTDFAPHAQAIADYAHSRGVKIGAVVQMFAESSLQNNYVLIQSDATWQADLEAKLDQLLGVSWDVVELALGEFIGANPADVISWLNHATSYVNGKAPNVELSAQIHVGNYPNLWLDYQGKKTFFYHLAGYTDGKLGSSVHTVFFFDLYRDWGTYKHDNFFLQRDYLMEQLPKRKVRYFPESAYWIAADVDVPQFLPEYIYARWLDISSLHKDICEQGLPELDGHVMFSSGKEWNYWLTDYLAAKMQWDPEADYESFLGHYTSSFGACGSELRTDLSKLTELQNEYLFDKRLVGYVSGEDNVLDLGFIAGYESHPRRVDFEKVTAMDEGELATFETNVIGELAKYVDKLRPLEKSVVARCKTADDVVKPWCDELSDGFVIDRLRAEHTLGLYRAVIDSARGGSTSLDLLAKAKDITKQAETVIARRETGYRFPLSQLVDAYQNPTIYEWGYLRQTHLACFWHRQDIQAETLITEGFPASFSVLPSCDD